MQTISIKVIAGSTREGRFSDKAMAWIADEMFALLSKPAEEITEQLLWWARALKTARG